MSWREVRNVFQCIDHEAGVFHLPATLPTLAQMGLQGTYPEAHLVIEEEVDLVWEQVSMVHWVSGNTYGMRPELVSGNGGTGGTVERWNGGPGGRRNEAACHSEGAQRLRNLLSSG
ncbi:MAG TPA: hypothetical protein VGM67_17060 [Gemmatimonadaceae bacterium]